MIPILVFTFLVYIIVFLKFKSQKSKTKYQTEVDQIKARQSTVRAAAPAQPRTPRRPSAKPEPPPLPFRIVGAELRAGQRSLSVAPNAGSYTPDQLEVLLPGDALGPWRLQAVEGNTAVFQTGDQTRRVAIP